MAGSDRSRIGHWFGAAAAVAAMLLANSCTDFTRTNPFDPAVPVTLTVSGPDSTFSQFDTVKFTVKTDPAYDYDPPEWSLGGLLRLDNNGTYQVRDIASYGRRATQVTISVKIGPRTATKSVIVTFQPKALRVRNCSDGTRTVTFTALGPQSAVWLCTTVVDARGGVIVQDADAPPYTLVARVLDSSVVKGSSRVLEPAGNGTTQVVYTYGPVSDTVTVSVQQKARWLTIAPSGICSGPPLSIGQSVQMTVGAPGRDANQVPLIDQTLAQREGQDMRWQVTWYDSTKPPPLSITPLGLITTSAAGYTWISTTSSTNPVGIQSLACFVEVR